METFYTLGDLKPVQSGQLLVRYDVDDPEKNKYILFRNYDEYLSEVERIKKFDDPAFHEVILDYMDRKFFLDIDLKIFHPEDEECTESLKKADGHFEVVKKILINEFNKMFSSFINKHHLKIVDSTGKVSGGTKYSKNIIVMGTVMNQPTFKTLLENILSTYNSLDNNIKGFVDDQQLSIKFNNRLPESSKYQNGRSLKRIKTFENVSHRDLIITNVENCIRRNTEEYNSKTKILFIEDETVKEYLEMTKHLWEDDFEYRNSTGNKINFNRLRPSHCDVCGETHHNDNTFYLSISENFVFANCRHAKLGEYYEYFRISEDEEVEEKVEVKRDNEIIENVDHVTQNAFSSYDVDFVKSGLGTGKSKALLKYLENYEDGDVIIILSFRVTFGIEMSKKFKDFHLYSDISDREIDLRKYPKLIIQTESLNKIRYDGNIKIKCLVLDEIESIWSQFSSGNFRDYNGSLNIFEWLYKTSRKVIGMDAFVSDRSYKLSKMIRQSTIFTYKNKFNRFTNTKYYTTCKKSRWLTKLVELVENGHNIGIFTNSLTEAKTIKKLLNCESIVYSSETKNSIKKEHFSDVNFHWKNYQVIICTSTVTAGISFEKKHFDYVFGLFNSRSCNVESCMQMLGRIRDVGENEYYICLPFPENDDIRYMTSVDDIEKGLIEKRSEVVGMLGSGYQLGELEFSYKDGIKYNKNFRYWITVHNIAFDNKSKTNFAKHFFGRLKEAGIKHEVMDGEIDNDINDDYNEKKVEQRQEIVDNIVKAELITEDQYEKMVDDNSKGIDVDNNAMSNYIIRRDFNIEGEPPTETVEKVTADPTFTKKYMVSKKFLEMEGSVAERVEDYIRHDSEKISYRLSNGMECDFNRTDFSSFRFSSCVELIKLINFANITEGDFFKFFTMFSVAIIEDTENQEFMTKLRYYYECLGMRMSSNTVSNSSLDSAKMFGRYLTKLFPVDVKVLKRSITVKGCSGYAVERGDVKFVNGQIKNNTNLPIIHSRHHLQ